MDIIEFKAEAQSIINANMERTIELARQAYEAGNRFNACLLVDPNQKHKVLEEGVDKTQRYITSISHCVIDVVNAFGNCIVIFYSI